MFMLRYSHFARIEDIGCIIKLLLVYLLDLSCLLWHLFKDPKVGGGGQWHADLRHLNLLNLILNGRKKFQPHHRARTQEIGGLIHPPK